ncbi:enoyl-CoA hydratase-related protein [Thauera linaloolentis]|uniref:Enoyl-CoA hydratase n=1 Tax=Thauera linaloolentis (strain DSM 12138 / JCM 21573 / CCUG 41526 / CIP 105981 / IAM 15112 / NBRC 102519 / 47Lol) TaxID=1123367 RepID=N6Z546_THAL4|nr:enoyl-CoA hydratase-related protein [Thauera linaloolentis]ENO89697.1 enoyl-CoA hydratase [Thauera linaloolentis 47Lol = DSM 12138]MCM8567177.1 enoyl-CoA hydratase-related protein [Thauera linaloolentis]
MAGTVLLDDADGVATLTLNRPQALNALSVEMMEDLAEAVRGLAARSDAAVVVVKGAGEHFMAGGDLKDFAARLHLSPEARLAAFKAMIAQYINPTVEILQGLRQPVIACVRGACAGFGLSLMAGCDLVVAADNARFTTAYSSIALSGDGGASYFLPRIVGARKAAELLLLAERFDAAEAQRLGLVNRVVPDAQLEEAVAALAARLRNGPRHTYGEIKRLLAASHGTPLESQLQSEAEAFARCAATADFAEGVTAFLDKRAPGFQGR